jgi:hypothetical protein
MDPELGHATRRPPTIGETCDRDIHLKIGSVTVSGASGSRHTDQHGIHCEHSTMVQRREYNYHFYNAPSHGRADITSLVTHVST